MKIICFFILIFTYQLGFSKSNDSPNLDFEKVQPLSWNEWKKELKETLKKENYKDSTLKLIDTIDFNPKVIKYDRKQPEFKLTFQKYLQRNITTEKKKEINLIYKKNKELLELLNEKFKKEKIKLEMSFQSRFGPQEWLKPYMQEKMDEFLKESQKDLIVVAPGFSVDCLETLEEIEIQGKEELFEKGGESFNYIRCLNDSEISINMYSKIINRELSGWI